MTDWWNTLSALQHMFLYAAVPFTILLFIQTILTFIGLGSHDADTDGGLDIHSDVSFDTHDLHDVHIDGHDTDGHADEPNLEIAGFRFFTVRGIVAFFCLFGWTGYVLSGTAMRMWLIILISVAAGLLAMLLIGLMFYFMRRLQENSNIRYSNAIGTDAEVYLPIPAQRSGKGKVMVLIQEQLIEAEAVTDNEQKIRTGETVHVIGNIGNTLIVTK